MEGVIDTVETMTETTPTFSDLGLRPEIQRAVADAGYTTPTPIQAQAIPVILHRRDMVGIAQTGTGKTGGFTLPMIQLLAQGRSRVRMPRSLILEPTRELAAQVAENFEKYGKYHKLSKALLIGGSSMSEQEAKLDRGVDVLIATPGRLLDLFERGKILLADVKILVIDEADRMLDMGFIPDVEKIVGRLPKIRQTLFFSATMPKEIRRLADQFLLNPKEISVAPPASPAETVEQGLIRLPGHDKRKALNILLDQEDVLSALVFCNRKRDVSALNKALQKRELAAGELHGDMAQSMRMETLERFKNGEIKILVCSDVAARGLDMPKVSHVFNYDVPNHAEDYVHRIGRTGRAGRSGKAFMLATPADGKSLAAIERAMNRAIPTVELDSVRILKPEEVEGELPAAEEKFGETADAQAAESAGEQTAQQEDDASTREHLVQGIFPRPRPLRPREGDHQRNHDGGDFQNGHEGGQKSLRSASRHRSEGGGNNERHRRDGSGPPGALPGDLPGAGRRGDGGGGPTERPPRPGGGGGAAGP